MHRFYIVWGENRFKPPTKKHPSYAEAKEEAERLAKKEGGKFHVLRLLATAETHVTFTEIDLSCEF